MPMFRPICQPSSQLWRFAAALLVVFALIAGRADADPIHVAVGSTTDVLVPANAEIVFDLLGGGTRLRGMAFGEESEDLLIVTPPGPDTLVTGASADLSSTSTFSMGFRALNSRVGRNDSRRGRRAPPLGAFEASPEVRNISFQRLGGPPIA